MTPTSPCPDRDQLARLLANQLRGDEEQALTAHIDQCPTCQQRLHHWAFDDDSWKDVADALQAGASAPDPLLERVLNDFQNNDNRTVGYDTPNDADGDSGPPLPVEGVPSALGLPPRYHMADEIARGGMGAVIKDHDAELGRDIAVKVMLETHQGKTELLQRFVEEAQIGGQLQHPGIVPIYDIGKSKDKRPYFTMKLIKGQTLSSLLKARSDPSQDLPKFLGIFEQICQTLAYAHAHGVIHRDLKPANIMVGNFGEVQVMDWGLAKVLPKNGAKQSRAHEEADEATTIRTVRSEGSDTPATRESRSGSDTQAGSVLGTPAYMPPEQAKGEIHELDERCDVFGLGAILCVILTGKPPYVGKDSAEVHRKAMRGDLDDAWQRLDACDADADMVTLTKRCLAVDKEERARDAGAAADSVTAYLESVQQRLQQAKIATAKAQTKAQEERKRRKVQFALAAAVLLMNIGAGSVGLWYQQDRASRHTVELLRQKNLEQRHAVREQQISDARNRGRELRSKLHNKLAEKGGVFKLLNNPADWQRQIDAVMASVQRARDLKAGAEQEINASLQNQIRLIAAQVEQDAKDRELAIRLETLRERAATLVKGKFNYAYALRKYPEVFKDAGLAVVRGTEKKVASQIRDSSIREQLIDALDNWARHIQDNQHLLAIARAADTDPRRIRLRQPILWVSKNKLQEFVELLDDDRKTMAQWSPESLAFVSFLLRTHSLDSEKWLRQVQMLYPEDFWINLELGNILHQKKKTAEAIGFFRAALAVRPKSTAVYNNLALCVSDSGDLKGAATILRKAITIASDDPDVWHNLGNVLLEQKQLKEAIRAYEMATKLAPNNSITWHNLAISLVAQKRLIDAVNAHKKALKIEPQNALYLAVYGGTLLKKRALVDAVAVLRNALKVDPKMADAWNDLGVIYCDHRRQFQKAEDAFRQATAHDRKHARAWVNLGHALLRQNKLDAAIAAYQEALVIKEPTPNRRVRAEFGEILVIDEKHHHKAWVGIGLALAEKKDMRGAIEAYKQSIALNDSSAVTWNNLGDTLRSMKNLPAAIEAFKKAVAIDPKLAQAWSNLGHALAGNNDLSGAINAYQKAVKFNPQNAYVWNRLGVILCDELHQYRKAEDAFRTAVKHRPKFAFAWFNLGVALQKQDKLTEAIPMYQKVVQLNGKDVDAYNWLGYCLRMTGRLEQAAKKFRKALEIDPNNASSHGEMGRTLVLSGHFKEGRDSLRRAQELNKKKNKNDKSVAGMLRKCELLIGLNERLLRVRKGAKTNWVEQCALAMLCQRYLKRNREAVTFYADAFAAEPKSADNLVRQYRYKAACAAVLAADRKGKDASKITDKDRMTLWQQAHDWLESDLALYRKNLSAKPLESVQIQERLRHWQNDEAFLSVREPKSLKVLPAAVGNQWRKLWASVDSLTKQARDRYTEERTQGLLTKSDKNHFGSYYKEYKLQLQAGRPCAIDLESQAFDSYLIVFDASGRTRLVQNDDIAPGKNLNSRLTFTPPKTAVYIIRVTSAQAKQIGAYTLITRKFHVTVQSKRMQDALTATQKEQTHEIKLSAGRTYAIDMTSKQFDTYLYLRDTKGNLLAENDDIGGGNLKSRLLFTPTSDGTYHLIASSYQRRGRGRYEIVVREFAKPGS